MSSNTRVANRRTGSLFLLIVLFLCAWLAGTSFGALEPEGSDYQIKAQHVFNFARFTEWPPSKFPQPDSPLIIGVVGSNELENQLDEVVKNARINDRQVYIKHIANNAELRRCHILFVSRSERDRFGAILSEARGEHILTIGENDRFLNRGGVVNFMDSGTAVIFQINLGAARHAGLKISSKLLQLRMAQVVNAEGQPLYP